MIKAYIGRVGSGKTLNMIYDLVKSMYHGRRVISNTPINTLYAPPFCKPRWCKSTFVRRGEDFLHALEYEQNCTIAMDEAAIFFPAQYWNKLPAEVLIKLAENRKFHCDIWYTTQGYAHTVKRLRDMTQLVHSCRKHWFLGWTTFQMKTFLPEFFYGMPTENKYKAYYLGQRVLWPSLRRRAYKAYDTNYIIDFSAMMKIKEKFQQPTWDGVDRKQWEIEHAKDTKKFDILPADILPDKNEVDEDLPPDRLAIRGVSAIPSVDNVTISPHNPEVGGTTLSEL